MFRKQYLSLLLAMVMVSGCTLSEVVDKGDSCPPDKSDGQSLSYVIVNSDSDEPEYCEADTCTEYAENFKFGVCPNKIPSCHVDKKGQYYCMKECTGKLVACDGTCVDPMNDTKYCGAKGDCNDKDSDSDNFQGRECDDICKNGICTTATCDAPNFKCGDYCIDPTNSAHCGAKGCDSDDPKSDDYKGKACNADESCIDGKCQCRDGLVSCDDGCINPLTNKYYCGAKGSCDSKDRSSDDYFGVQCTDKESCVNGVCVLNECENPEETACDGVEGKVCKNLNVDELNCGHCGYSCEEHLPENTEFSSCSEAKCRYTCKEGFENCGTDDASSCVNLNDSLLHCGACGNACNIDEGESCIQGQCMVNGCQDGCWVDGECTNSDEQCGPGCVNCNVENFAASGTCSGGKCIISTCRDGYHLGTSGEDTVCVQNSDTECAPGDSMTPVDCTAQFQDAGGFCSDFGICLVSGCDHACFLGGECVNSDDSCGISCVNCNGYQNAAVGKCNEEGVCVASSCNPGYHLDGKGGCASNSNTECAPVDSSAVVNCEAKYGAGAGTCNASGQCATTSCSGSCLSDDTCVNETTKCGEKCLNCNVEGNASAGTCSGGKCKASSCQTGYHLKGDGCEGNTNALCAAVDSADVKDCTKSVNNGTGKCSNGSCVFDSCNSGFCKTSSNTCVNTDSQCGSSCSDCTKSVANGTAKCSGGTCVFSSCSSGFCKTSSNTCVNSDKQCGTSCSDCTGTVQNGKGKCSNGSCTFASCNSGYCKTSSNTCVSTDKQCGSSCADCTGTVQNGTGKCSSGSCVFGSCNSGYCKTSSNTCVSTDKQCGSSCTDCTAISHGTGYCSSGSCVASSCDSGYHTYGAICEKDSDNHCGKHGNPCGGKESCIGGKCRLTECEEGDEPSKCWFSDGSTGVCKTTGAKGGENIKCVTENTRDTECFVDGTPKSCKASGSGSTGTCIYDPSLAGKYAGRSQRWICECSGKVFCLSKAAGKYKCTTSSDCKYIY